MYFRKTTVTGCLKKKKNSQFAIEYMKWECQNDNCTSNPDMGDNDLE